MSQQSNFLGISHDMSQLPVTGAVEFWPKASIEDTLRAYIAQFRRKRTCTPAEASKFRGTAGFMALAQWGQLGRSGLSSFKRRQYWDVPPWTLSRTVDRAIEFVKVTVDVNPRRLVYIDRPVRPSLVIASDAHVEPGRFPGGGFLIHDTEDCAKEGAWPQLTEQHLETRGLSFEDLLLGRQPIALCEAAMLPCAMLA